jgi:cell division protease FtsH
VDKSVKTVVFWLVIAVSAMLLWKIVRASGPRPQQTSEISYSQFMSEVDSGNVESVDVAGTKIHGRYHGGEPFI